MASKKARDKISKALDQVDNPKRLSDLRNPAEMIYNPVGAAKKAIGKVACKRTGGTWSGGKCKMPKERRF